MSSSSAQVYSTEGAWEPFHVSRGFAPEDCTVTVATIQDPEMLGRQGWDRAHDLAPQVMRLLLEGKA